MSDIDFNVKNYDLNELLAIIDWNDELPLSPEVIKWKTYTFKKKYEKQPKYFKFFSDVEKRLLSEWKNVTCPEYGHPGNDFISYRNGDGGHASSHDAEWRQTCCHIIGKFLEY